MCKVQTPDSVNQSRYVLVIVAGEETYIGAVTV